ncbi:MAG: hypothetical protein INH13_31795, partial [Cupriavidus sp.]|nr:hypothetical protein [Cupriavidus sp.]
MARLGNWRPLLLAATGYFVLALAGLWLARMPGHAAAVWLANAFGLGMLLHRPTREAPSLLVTMLAANIVANVLGAGHPAGAALLLAATGYFVLALAGLWLARMPGHAAAVWLANAFGLGMLLHR